MRTVAVAVLGFGLLAPAVAYADPLPLPKPAGEIPIPAEAVADRPERLRRSQVPGEVDDTERVDVGLGPDGAPAAVSLTQRLVLHGTGQFVIWERSSAQDVEPLEDTDPPVLKREAVIWQGFVNRRKELAARLTLDPVIERELLPLGVTLAFTGGPIGPGGTLPGPGTLSVTVANRTAQPMALPTGRVAAKDLARPLDTLLNHAHAEWPAPPPTAGRGLPVALPATGTGRREVNVAVPFRLKGTVRALGATPLTPESPAVRHVTDGVAVNGVLHGEVRFDLAIPVAGALELDLTAFPALDPRTLRPPRGETWADWLRRGPFPNEVADATEALVDAAAQAARADEYAPYLGHHGPGGVETTFRFAMAPAVTVAAPPAPPLEPRPFGIALASLALLGVLTNATVVWRRL